MVDAVISPLLKKVGAIIGDQISYEFNSVKGVKEELPEISRSLTAIRNVLDDAEYKGMKDRTVKHWLNKLEITACDMSDILDEWDYYSLHKQKTEPSVVQKLLNFLLKTLDCSFIPSSCLCFNEVFIRRDIAKKIQNAKASLDQIFKEMDGFKFIVGLVNTSRRGQSTPLIDPDKVYGVDIRKKKEDIVSKLMLNGGDIRILSIVGTGGLGKTTLAKLVYNDERVEDCFDLKIWICVSDPFDVAGIAIGIVNEVGIETIPPNSNQLALVLGKLKASILGKRFLLVLDDVWTEDNTEWEPLKLSLQCGAVGSKILVTTRKETVAKMVSTTNDDMYHPNKLSEEECWSLLRDTSLPGKSDEECGKFMVFGKKIASKCNGLPLAAVVLGRLLQFKDLEGWEHVEKSEIWQLERVEVELFPHLFLSYNELSPALKHCFSYCAVYPKDKKIYAKTLIEEWMAQGYLGSDSGNGALELEGRENLRHLAMRSLFQDIEKSESGEEIEWCKMHDIVHDFALSLRKNDEKERNCQDCDSSLVSHVLEYRRLSWYYRPPPVVERDRSCKVCDCMKTVRVFKIWMFSSSIPVGIETLIHLRWLDLSWIKLSKDGFEIICRLYFLQTLLLSGCKLTEIPREIGNLDRLRRLDLSHNRELKELPESMYSLVELRSLSLAGCSLKEIQKEIGKLVQLRHLDLSQNYGLELPESICSLVELQILKIKGTHINFLPEALGELSNLHTLELCEFKVGSEFNKLGFLKKLHCCCLSGSLELLIFIKSMSEMVEMVEDARQAQLKTLFQKLETLDVFFMKTLEMEKSSSSPSSMWMDLLEALVPHFNFKTLEIKGYQGSRLPGFMSSPLNFIKQICLGILTEVSSLPAMGKLPFLEFLHIYFVDQLVFVGREFLGIESSSHDIVVVAFPKLKELRFYMCHKWEEWEDITEEEEESAAISIMPCLKGLTIMLCERLKKLPHRLLCKVSSSLQELNIWGSSELIKTYGEDKEGSAWRSISQHNPQLQLEQ